MRRAARGLIVAVASLAAVALPVSTATALADGSGGPKPSVENESASNITATDATLEATIDPGSGEDGFALETTYEFFLEAPWCGTQGPGFCEGTGGTLVDKGTIAAGATAPQVESVDLASVGQQLSPDTTYGYRVVARNEVGEAFGFERTFTTSSQSSGCVEDPQDCNRPPVIDSLSVGHVSPTDATLEAAIDTEGQPTLYAFELTYRRCGPCEDLEPVYWIPLPAGLLLGSFEDQSVSLDLNSAGVSLKPGFYEYSLIATGFDGEKAEAPWQSFEPPPGTGMIGPPASTSTPGPVSNEPTAPLAGGQTPPSGGTGSPPPAGGAALAGSSKPAHGKPAAKHGKRHKHKHKHHHTKGHHKPKKHG